MGAGASAVVLVSYAGDEPGHALVLHATSEGLNAAAGGLDAAIRGLRWADPAGGVTVEPPLRVRRAVAAWAVVVGPDGRVAEPDDRMGEPGGWSAPAGMLADPPVRHDFGAMGVEIERHDVRLFLPGLERLLLPAGTVLLRSRDGLVRVDADYGGSWRGPDDVLYSSKRAMAAAGGSVPGTSSRGEPEKMSVPETVVARPWAAGAAEQGQRPSWREVRARILDVDERWRQAPAAQTYTLGEPDRYPTLAGLLPDEDYEIEERFRSVRVVRYPRLFAGAPLYPQLSVGVPLGGGVLAVLDELVASIGPRSPGAAKLGAAMRFGWQVSSAPVATRSGFYLPVRPALDRPWLRMS
jgi:hypothetical protein